MRSLLRCTVPIATLLVIGPVLDCGGTAAVVSGDASVDGAGGSGSGSGGTSSSGSGTSSGGGSGSSGSSGSSSSSGSGTSSGSSSGSSGGNSGSSSSSGSGTSSGSSGSSGAGSSSGSSSGGNCPTCQQGLLCCNGVACDVDSLNDPHNCGGCNQTCPSSMPFCKQGTCAPTPCDGQPCAASLTCCGSQCCQAGDICCETEGPTDSLECYTPTAAQPSCPPGCPACVSDRNLKRDIVPVDPDAVLEGVVRVPVATWSYKTDDPSVRHLGPMAQDFYGEFGLGKTDKAYSAIDAHGVAFAAIQALYERLQEQDARIRKLEEENAELRRTSRRAR